MEMTIQVTKTEFYAIGGFSIAGTWRNDNGHFVEKDSKAFKALNAYRSNKKTFCYFDYI